MTKTSIKYTIRKTDCGLPPITITLDALLVDSRVEFDLTIGATLIESIDRAEITGALYNMLPRKQKAVISKLTRFADAAPTRLHREHSRNAA